MLMTTLLEWLSFARGHRAQQQVFHLLLSDDELKAPHASGGTRRTRRLGLLALSDSHDAKHPASSSIFDRREATNVLITDYHR
jgi:hypothetical protein